jgi:heme-degrading monooxygenase HmoA
MVIEHALLPVRPGTAADFEAAFAEARAVIAASPGFQRL